MRVSKKAIFYIAFFALLSIAFLTYAGYAIYQANGTIKHVEHLPILGPGHTVQGFSFVNQEGRTITNNDVKGKTYVAEYFFTTCKGICPKMNANLEKVYARYRNTPNFLILSHTVDPETDSVPVLKAYALKHGADSKNWWFLTGNKRQLYKLARESYLVDDGTDTGPDDFVHTQWFALVDKEARIRGLYEGTKMSDIDKLNTDIGLLMAEK
ncbi:protein SCO1/2 [Chitinophaga costaii]|uniref:Protein SCO1/2 n=1 Tax=Chitinophaga costaii TaxID=1335309 RepID=A0A1C4B059_9BACT|nr:SCO family protein [Chitinophaga costaii]PUZ26816.1 SCO family protein [Chitinophaga costaii]SCC00112.1 protein SCO1/2 [Chitinophaga costaii]